MKSAVLNMQSYALILAAALIGMTSAQTTTTSLFLVGFDKQSILGSVVGSVSGMPLPPFSSRV